MVGAAAANVDASPVNLGRKAMLDRILHQRLQDHTGHEKVERGRFEFLDHLQLVTPKARHFDIEIIIQKLQLLAQGDERVSLAQQPPQNVADRKSTRLNSSHLGISYAVFC